MLKNPPSDHLEPSTDPLENPRETSWVWIYVVWGVTVISPKHFGYKSNGEDIEEECSVISGILPSGKVHACDFSQSFHKNPFGTYFFIFSLGNTSQKHYLKSESQLRLIFDKCLFETRIPNCFILVARHLGLIILNKMNWLWMNECYRSFSWMTQCIARKEIREIEFSPFSFF